jgi:hypothetical protein
MPELEHHDAGEANARPSHFFQTEADMKHLTEWQEQYTRMRDGAERIRRMRTNRLRRLARQAGLDPAIPTLHAHNAMVGFEQGRPWRGVDYSLVRLILRFEPQIWVGYHILERWSDRTRPSATGDPTPRRVGSASARGGRVASHYVEITGEVR